MRKSPIVIFFLIATFIMIEIFIMPYPYKNYFIEHDGLWVTIKSHFYCCMDIYVPISIFIITEILKEIFKNGKMQKIINVINKIFIVIVSIFYILYEIFFLYLYFGTMNMEID